MSSLVATSTVGTDTDIDSIWEHGVQGRNTGGRQRRVRRQRRQELEVAVSAARATLAHKMGQDWEQRAEANLAMRRGDSAYSAGMDDID